MKLRFKVDQGEALRQGVDAPTSVVTIEINPKTLTQQERNLLADRMEGIDVRELFALPVASSSPDRPGKGNKASAIARGKHITATLGTFKALMDAVRKNEEEVQASLRSFTAKN
jgi:hypothetical protein